MQLIVEPGAKSPSNSFNFNPDFCRDKRLFINLASDNCIFRVKFFVSVIPVDPPIKSEDGIQRNIPGLSGPSKRTAGKQAG